MSKKTSTVRKFRVTIPVMLTAAQTAVGNMLEYSDAFAADYPRMTRERAAALLDDIKAANAPVGDNANVTGNGGNLFGISSFF